MSRATISERFGARVRALRQMRGWSQARLAEAVDLSPNHVGVIERGEKAPTLDTIDAIATALGTSPAQLLADVQEKGAAAWLAQMQAILVAVPPAHRELVAGVVGALVQHLSDRTDPAARQRAPLRLHERGER